MTRHKVLCVDDEALLLKSLKRLLSKEPYELITAPDGDTATALIAEHDFAVVVADQRMPGMNGTELLEQVKIHSKNTIRVILSGYADLDIMMDSINKGNVYMYIKKPWNDDKLKAAIRQCIVHFETTKQNDTLLEHINFQREEILKSQAWMEEKHGSLGPHFQLLTQALAELPVPVLIINKDEKMVFINKSARILFPSLEGIVEPLDMQEALISEITDRVEIFLKSEEAETELDAFSGTVKVNRISYDRLTLGCSLTFFIEDQI
jgi:response regulator RpfG family c-di-GMP phosphodiesterase